MTEITEDNFDRIIQHPVVISSEIREQIISDSFKAKLFDRIDPFIEHVTDCYVCHKQGTDRCSWIINKNNKTKKPDVEIIVLPDTIEEAQKALDKMK